MLISFVDFPCDFLGLKGRFLFGGNFQPPTSSTIIFFACHQLIGLPSMVDEKAVDSGNFYKQKSLSICKCLS